MAVRPLDKQRRIVFTIFLLVIMGFTMNALPVRSETDHYRSKINAVVDNQHAAGIVTLVVKDKQIIDFSAYGYADLAAQKTITTDAITHIASMTKPITGAAMMRLYERGLWSLDDPVTKFIPEFNDLKVLSASGKLVAPDHIPTMRELMSHSAGFTYSFIEKGEVNKRYAQANLRDTESNLSTMIHKLKALPLKNQPGSEWEYSIAVDIQGYIIEKLSGMSYVDFVRKEIFSPLKMHDSDFYVPEDKRHRIAFPHVRDDNEKIVNQLSAQEQRVLANQTPSFASPGGSIWSTASDYGRFCQMLLNGGELDGVRILMPETVKMMHTNMLPDNVYIDIPRKSDDTLFGLGFAIADKPAQAGEPWPTGTYYWLGAFGTFFWIDPVNNLYVVGMVNRVFDPLKDRDNALAARDITLRGVYSELFKE